MGSAKRKSNAIDGESQVKRKKPETALDEDELSLQLRRERENSLRILGSLVYTESGCCHSAGQGEAINPQDQSETTGAKEKARSKESASKKRRRKSEVIQRDDDENAVSVNKKRSRKILSDDDCDKEKVYSKNKTKILSDDGDEEKECSKNKRSNGVSDDGDTECSKEKMEDSIICSVNNLKQLFTGEGVDFGFHVAELELKDEEEDRSLEKTTTSPSNHEQVMADIELPTAKEKNCDVRKTCFFFHSTSSTLRNRLEENAFFRSEERQVLESEWPAHRDAMKQGFRRRRRDAIRFGSSKKKRLVSRASENNGTK